MAAVSINTGGVCHEDKLSDTPREQWPALLRERRMYIETQFEYDCRCIVQYLAEAEEFHAELGYDSADDMIQQELLIRPEWVRIAVDWLTQQDRPEPVTKAEVEKATQAVAAQAHAEQMLSLSAPQFAQAGDNQHTLKNGGDNITTRANDTAKGTSAAYLAARLKKAKRDDLLAEIGPGKRFQSVRAAAIEAGIIKPVPTVRLVDDPVKVAAAIRKHLTPEQLAQLVEALTASPS